MIGAILTQATSWLNAEKAIDNLRKADCLEPGKVRAIPLNTLASLIYPSVYYNKKAKALKSMANFTGNFYQDNFKNMANIPTRVIRSQLLGLNGLGNETVDDILLYALGHPVFVIDSYTRRLFSRLGRGGARQSYLKLQHSITQELPIKTKIYSEYHALIDVQCKNTCKKEPLCNKCCLRGLCEFRLQKSIM